MARHSVIGLRIAVIVVSPCEWRVAVAFFEYRQRVISRNESEIAGEQVVY